MARASAAFALACGLLGALPAAGVLMNTDEAEAMTELAEALSHVSLEALPPEFNASRLRILADLQQGRKSEAPEEEGGYDCGARPYMCQAPFHCDKWTHEDTMDVRMHGLATPDGHANLRSWCMPGLERYASTVVRECVTDWADELAPAELRRASSKSAHQRSSTDWADELDASYCFAEGHCTFAAASESSTLADMEKMCDHRFGGRQGWTKNFLANLKRLMDMPGLFSNLVSTNEGFRTQRVTRVLSKMACAQGIFHCDVEHCKRTYCRDEYFVKKYGHLLPKVKGDDIEDPDLTKEMLSQAKKHRHHR